LKFIRKMKKPAIWKVIKASFANDPTELQKAVSEPQFTKEMCIIFSATTFLLINYLLNTLPTLLYFLSDSSKVSVSVWNAFKFRLSNWPFYLVLIGAIAIMDSVLAYRIRSSYGKINTNEKGTTKWATLEELRKEYKSIPCKTKRFPGNGGLPVSWDGDKILIDDMATNAILNGITRSGKGEMFVYPLIDIYSRAEKQASMVILDPKEENIANSYNILKERGYEVHALNLADPNNSMGFNVLQPIVEKYREGDKEEAQRICRQYCAAMYNPDSKDGDDAFWQSTGADLLGALIMGMLIDAYEMDQEEYEKKAAKVDKLNEEGAAAWKEKQDKFSSLPATRKKRIAAIFEAHRMSDRQTSMQDIASALGVSERTVQNYLRIKTEDLEAVPPDLEYIPIEKEPMGTENTDKVNMYSAITAFSELVREKNQETGKSKLDKYFEMRPKDDIAKLLYLSVEIPPDRTRGSIYSTMISKLSLWMYDSFAKMTATSTINMEDIGYGDKPMAIFLILPDYDTSNYFLASIFISQLYYFLSKRAAKTPGRHCKRRVVFILDEAGSLPEIPGLATSVTVGLSRWLVYYIFVQNLSQLSNRYGDKNAETIVTNCGNKVYILSDDEKTIKKFQSWMGGENISSYTRSGEQLSMSKSFTESSKEKPLLETTEMMRLLQGECVIVRASKRTDLQGNPIHPRSIFAHGDTRLRFRYQYLDEFKNDDVLASQLNLCEFRPDEKVKVFDIQKAFNYGRSRAAKEAKKQLISTLEEPNFLYLYAERVVGEEAASKMTIEEFEEFLQREYEAERVNAATYDNFKQIISEVTYV
jgi:type IV secretion system protein VirD4